VLRILDQRLRRVRQRHRTRRVDDPPVPRGPNAGEYDAPGGQELQGDFTINGVTIQNPDGPELIGDRDIRYKVRFDIIDPQSLTCCAIRNPWGDEWTPWVCQLCQADVNPYGEPHLFLPGSFAAQGSVVQCAFSNGGCDVDFNTATRPFRVCGDVLNPCIEDLI